MLAERRILVSLLALVEHLPSPPQKRKHGRQETYSDKLFIKALIVMISGSALSDRLGVSIRATAAYRHWH